MVTLPDIATLLTNNPELVALLAVVLRLARAYQSELTWPEYRAIHRFKRGAFPLVHMAAKGRLHLINDKGGRDDAEYVTTVDAGPRETAKSMRQNGGSLHLLCSIKKRPDTHGDPLTDAHVIWTMSDGQQVEAYIFQNNNGTCDVYCHTEASTDDPLAHLTAGQQDGDRYGVLPADYSA